MRRPVIALITAPALALAGALTVAAPASAAVGTEAELVTALTTAVDGDTIELAGDITLTADLPVIDADVEIIGGGSTLDGAGSYETLRIAPNHTVTIRDLTVADAGGAGVAVDDTVPGDGEVALTLDGVTITGSAGAGVDARLSGTLTVTDVRIETNTGSGLDVELQGGELEIADAVISRNGGHGVYATGDGGDVTITGSQIDANGDPSLEWDGVLLLEVNDFRLSMSDTTTSDNNRHGTRIRGSDIAVDLTRVTADHNGYPDFGFGFVLEATGGIATLDAVDSELSTNIESGMFLNVGLTSEAALRIDRVTVADNARGGISAYIGDGTRFDLVNSTIVGNGYAPSATYTVAVHVENTGGGAVANLSHTTVVGNHINTGWPAVGILGAERPDLVPLQAALSHMIISDNGESPNDLGEIDAGLMYEVTIDHSYIGRRIETVDPPIAAAIAAGVGNISGLDPQLGALADNGGYGRTMLPLPGSPVLDAGVATLTAPTTDQRGLARVAGPAADLGAVEVQPAPPTQPEGDGEPQLADTGADAALPAALALLAMLGGITLLGRRRRRA